jgi:hypothetical protein
MVKLTVELNEETAQRLAEAAERAQMPAGDWVAALIRTRVCGEWPQSVRELAGSMPDFPEAAELRQTLQISTYVHRLQM